tara:strand:- start:8570 stop:9085 length:516 start_codon:yes stop_codon:yes gene_type:complete
MRIQRHHLIEEAKADLDRTYEAVKQAENSLITLDVEFGKKISAVKKANGAQMPEKIAGLLAERDEKKNILDIKELYMLEKAALERFSVLSAAFSTVFAHPDEESVALALGNTVFRPGEYIKVGPDVENAVREFARSLRAYTTEAASVENDVAVRDSWTTIEKTLRSFGRAI